LLTTVAGLAVAVWAFGATGWHGVLKALVRIGPGGFLLFCLWFLGVFVLLGAAWLSAAPGEPLKRLWLFTWARMVREAASDLLPFSQLGGVVLAVRTLTVHGLASRRANGALLVDMTTEMAAQVVFTVVGIALFLTTVTGEAGSETLRPVIFSGTAAMLALMAAFFVAHRFGLGHAGRLATRLLPGADSAAAEIADELRATYANSGTVALSFLFNLLAWLASAAGAWIGLRLMGVTAPFSTVLMVESLIFTLRSVAFAVPGALGVQEVGYLALAPIAGIAPQALLALSLAKRARDLVIGLPTLICWQLIEARAIVGSQQARRSRGALE
jgi:putative membrane protein